MRIYYILWIISVAERLEILIKWSVESKNPPKIKKIDEKTLMEKRAALVH